MSQHGAQEAAELPTDRVSNSICSRSAGGSVFTPRSNPPFCSLVSEEMLSLLIGEANKRSIKALGESTSCFFSVNLSAIHILHDSSTSH